MRLKGSLVILAVLLLAAALCAVSISFYCNHSRLGERKVQLTTKEQDRKFSEDNVGVLRATFGDEFRNMFPVHRVVLDSQVFMFCDLLTSGTVPLVADEIGTDAYDFSGIEFKPGDVVIDIGGNVGMISTFLAKKFPFLKIYAFEPVKENFENFLRNIKLNGIADGVITVKNLAITSDGRDIVMRINASNSGGSSMVIDDGGVAVIVEDSIPYITLDDIFAKNVINACKLLKVDCEGAEYEILYNTNKDTLRRCEHLRGEFHEDDGIVKSGYSAIALERYCSSLIGNVFIDFHISKNGNEHAMNGRWLCDVARARSH